MRAYRARALYDDNDPDRYSAIDRSYLGGDMASSERAVTVAVVGGVFAVIAAVVPIILTQVLSGDGATSTPVTPPPIEAPANPRGEASLFLNKESASVGETVLVSGKGFGASEIVDILVGAETVASPRTSPSGEFAIVSVVPFPRPYASQVNVTATGRGTIKSARAPLKITIRAG